MIGTLVFVGVCVLLAALGGFIAGCEETRKALRRWDKADKWK